MHVEVSASTAEASIIQQDSIASLEQGQNISKRDKDAADYWMQYASEALAKRDHKGGAKAIANSLVYNPYNLDGWIKLYRSYLYLKQTKYALNSLRKALKYFPDESYFYRERSKMNIELQRFDLAAHYIEMDIKKHPTNEINYFILARILCEQKKYDQALKALDVLEALETLNGSGTETNTNTEEVFDWDVSAIKELRGDIYMSQGLPEQAIEEYNKGLAVSPSPNLYFGRSYAYYQLQKYEQALSDAEYALILDPFNYKAWDYQARSFHALGQYEDALDSFNTSLSIKPKAYRDWEKIKYYIYAQERYYAAIQTCNALLEEDPDDIDLLNRKAEILLDLYEQREKLIELKEDSKSIMRLGERDLTHTKALEDIAEIVDQTLEADPNNPQYWLNHGRISYYFWEFEEAIESFEKSIELGLEEKKTYIYLAKTYESVNMLNRAEKNIQKAIELDSYDGETWYLYALLLNKSKRFTKALEALDKVLDFNRHYAQAWYLYGDINLGLEKPMDALASFEQALIYKPENKIYLKQLGSTYAMLGFLDEAINVFDYILEEQPSYTSALVSKGRVLRDKGMNDEALMMFDTVLEQEPFNMAVMMERARTLLYLGDFEKALKVTNDILLYDLSDSDAWLLKGMVYYFLEKHTYASNALYNSLDLNISQKNMWLQDADADEGIGFILNNSKGEALYYQSAVALELEQYESALEFINSALELRENNITYLSHKIDVLEHIGGYDDEVKTIRNNIKLQITNSYKEQEDTRGQLSIEITMDF